MIKINNLNKIYNQNKQNEFYAIKDINLDIKKGEIIVLKGISGSGKSTLLSLIASFSNVSSGDIVVNNQIITKLPDLHKSKFRNNNIGFIFQSFNLIEQLSVYDNVYSPLIITNKTNKKQLVDDILKDINIYHKKDEIISNLSGGEKQRCAIARALVNNPNIILADEPTANLDRSNSLKFIDILKKFKELNKTVIIATHDSIFDNIDFITRIIDIKNGKII